MKHLKLWIAVGVAVMLAIPAIALAATVTYDGHIGRHTVMGLDARVRHSGRITKVKNFGWDGLKLACNAGTDRFTGGMPNPIRVRDNKFRDGQSIGNGLKAHVRGRFLNDGQKAEGTLRVRGAGGCDTGRKSWAARPRPNP